MKDDFNRFAGLRFARTQPPEWRSIPFEDEKTQWRLWLKVAGIIAMWIALFALSMYSIAQQVPK